MLDSVRIPVDLTISSHMSCATADTADDVGGEVTLLRAVVLAVTDTTAILADLIFVITKSTIKSGKFTELVTLVIVLTFGSRCGLKKSL